VRPTRRTAIWRAIAGGLLLWLVIASAKTYPFYLAYFNEIVGGPGNGYKYLSASNLDWGQDLKDLSSYVHQHAITRLKFAYFGTDDPRAYGISYEKLLPGHPTTGNIAVSATALVGTRAGCERAFEWLRRYDPRAKIGYSIFIYYIPTSATLPPTVPFHNLDDC
jgi:hypothetical protein